MDSVSRIRGSIKKWRTAFPCARAVNVKYRNDIVDADFVHIRGDARVRLHTVIMWGCLSVTDAAFVHLRGIHTLNMFSCYQDAITDAAFRHLRGIHTIVMTNCTQLTDAAFVHLRGIHTLYMCWCNQETITPIALTYLAGIKMLDTSDCSRAVRIASAALMKIDYESVEELFFESDDTKVTDDVEPDDNLGSDNESDDAEPDDDMEEESDNEGEF
jgi:hypothetical protein